MKHRRILLSPLNWGFGHAGRMIPLARGLRERGHEVIFAIDPDLKAMVENELTDISIIDFPGIKNALFALPPSILKYPYQAAAYFCSINQGTQRG